LQLRKKGTKEECPLYCGNSVHFWHWRWGKLYAKRWRTANWTGWKSCGYFRNEHDSAKIPPKVFYPTSNDSASKWKRIKKTKRGDEGDEQVPSKRSKKRNGGVARINRLQRLRLICRSGHQCDEAIACAEKKYDLLKTSWIALKYYQCCMLLTVLRGCNYTSPAVDLSQDHILAPPIPVAKPGPKKTKKIPSSRMN